jgi:hypothetical protein
MTKILLAGVAVLALAGTASAEHDVGLPQDMLGKWCRDPIITTKSEDVYFRPYRVEYGRTTCEDNTNGITITDEGYGEDGPSDNPDVCQFGKIERVDYDDYLIQRTCEDGTDKAEFHLSHDLLFVRSDRRAWYGDPPGAARPGESLPANPFILPIDNEWNKP